MYLGNDALAANAGRGRGRLVVVGVVDGRLLEDGLADGLVHDGLVLVELCRVGCRGSLVELGWVRSWGGDSNSIEKVSA